MATRIVIIGGGPAGYEAALVAAARGREVAEVTVVDATASAAPACCGTACRPRRSSRRPGCAPSCAARPASGFDIAIEDAKISLEQIHNRVKTLAKSQSTDIGHQLLRAGVNVVQGRGELVDDQSGMAHHRVKVTNGDGRVVGTLKADVVLIATGASPRVLPSAKPDGERILNWRQLYDLTELPEHLVIVGSGVTGAEFCNAYTELGVAVTVVASRDQILPHEDSDAAAVLEEAFAERGVKLVKNARADSVTRTDDGVLVKMADGRTVEGSHALMTVGSVPNTSGLGLEKVGIELGPGNYLPVDRVSRTTASGIYAAGDCTGLLPLASVAAMQGRIAMYHALGEAVSPIRLRTVAAAVFTRPEIAAVGVPQTAIDDGTVAAQDPDAAAQHQRARQDVAAPPRFREDLLSPRDGCGDRRCRGGADRIGADPADRAGGAEQPLGDRPGSDAVGVSVAVGFDHRSGPTADGARRSGLRARNVGTGKDTDE